MTQFRSSDTKLLALREAVRQGRPDIAVNILSAKPSVRAYVRSPNSPLGVQIHSGSSRSPGTSTSSSWTSGRWYAAVLRRSGDRR